MFSFGDLETSPDEDQQFAQPIEDEDLFQGLVEQTSNQKVAPLTATQIKLKAMRDRIRQQVLDLSLLPNKLGTGLEEGGDFEVIIDGKLTTLEPESNFKNMLKRSEKLKDSPEVDKKNWIAYKTAIRRNISSQKRKIWDTFQQPVDVFDEEELIEESQNDNSDNESTKSNQSIHEDIDDNHSEQEDKENTCSSNEENEQSNHEDDIDNQSIFSKSDVLSTHEQSNHSIQDENSNHSLISESSDHSVRRARVIHSDTSEDGDLFNLGDGIESDIEEMVDDISYEDE